MKLKLLTLVFVTLLSSMHFYNAQAQKKWTALQNASSPFGAIYDLKINGNNQLYAQTGAGCFGGEIVKYDTSDWSNPIAGYCDYGSITKMQTDSFDNIYVNVAMRSPNPSYDVVCKISNKYCLIFDTINFTPGVQYNFYESIAVSPSGEVFASVLPVFNGTVLQPSKYDYSTSRWNIIYDPKYPLTGGGYSLIYTNNFLYALIRNNPANKYNLGKWDGTNWKVNSTLNAGDTIKYLYKGYQNSIYAKGTFTNGGTSTTRVLYNYATNNWDALSPSAPNPYADTCIKIESIITDKWGNYFGISQCKNSLGQQYVAEWNGIIWNELPGLNIDFNLSALAVDTSGIVYSVGGTKYNQYVVTYVQIVPLKLLQFEVLKKNNSISLSWQTANEINTSHFNIQSSTTGKDFNTIGKVNAKGVSEYNFIDPLTAPSPKGALYYRLEIVDKDGSKTYSEIRELRMENGQLTISPNPAKDKVTITGVNLKQVRVLNYGGRLLETKEVANNTAIDISVGQLPKGLYMVQATYNDGSIKTEKLVVE